MGYRSKCPCCGSMVEGHIAHDKVSNTITGGLAGFLFGGPVGAIIGAGAANALNKGTNAVMGNYRFKCKNCGESWQENH